jgi:hypothetical protein
MDNDVVESLLWIEAKAALPFMPSERAALREAATLITSLREALEPFAGYLDTAKHDLNSKGEPLSDEQGMGWVYLIVGDFRRARTALNPKERLDALLERARSNNPSRKETGI